MKLNYLFLAGVSALAMAACTPPDSGEPTGPDAATPPPETTDTADTTTPEAAEPGTAAVATYELEPTHAFLSFTVIHGGISEYTVDFTDFTATLDFNEEDPSASSLTATINPLGLNVNYPSDFKAGHANLPYETWPETLSKDPRFLDAEDYPEIKFVSTSIEKTGDDTGTVTGDLTFLGVTKPVTLDVTYNGVANAPWYGERDLIGFNANGSLSRSEFGQTSLEGIISDEVEIRFSGEFLQEETPATEPETTETEN